MFSSKSKDLPVPPQPAAAAPQAPKRGRAAPSIICADMVIQGSINSTGDVQIDGRLEGDVRSAGLVIGDQAEIQGEIYAEEVNVRGKVMGSIRARRVLLAATAHVEGDILHEALSVEAGAFFEGNCRHSDNPVGNPVADNPAGDAGKRNPPPRAVTAESEPGSGLFAPLSPVAT
jgi:cytoskeletal protein CcmA (bactofilin family)